MQTTEAEESGADSPVPGSDEKAEVTSPGKTNNELPRLSGLALYALIASMLLLVFIVILDVSIMATAIPRITDDFHTIADIGWYGSAYMLSQCSVQPLSGRIFSFFPLKASFLAFFGVFELGSLICGIAQSSKMLIIGRAICGIGSAGVTNAVLTVVGVASPPGRKAMIMGIVLSLSSCGQVIAPLIGGALTQHVSWRWCFYLNLPVGGLSSLGFLFTPFPDMRTGKTKSDRSLRGIFMGIDVPGFLLFAPSCIMLLLAFEWAGTEYAWKSATVIGLLCGAVGLFSVFVFWERWQGDLAMIPRSLVGNRVVFSACLASLFNGSSVVILSYYLPIYFQATKDASPTSSGVYMLPSFVTQVIIAVATGSVMRKVRYAVLPMIVGASLATASFGLLSTLKLDSGAGEWIGYQIVAGAARGISIQMPILVVQSTISKTKLATGTAMIMWSQFFGMAVFLGIAETIFLDVVKRAVHENAPSLDATVVTNAGATGFESVVPAQYYNAVARAYDKGVVYTFYLGIALSFAILVSSLGVGGKRIDSKSDGPTPPAKSMTDASDHDDDHRNSGTVVQSEASEEANEGEKDAKP